MQGLKDIKCVHALEEAADHRMTDAMTRDITLGVWAGPLAYRTLVLNVTELPTSTTCYCDLPELEERDWTELDKRD